MHVQSCCLGYFKPIAFLTLSLPWLSLLLKLPNKTIRNGYLWAVLVSVGNVHCSWLLLIYLHSLYILLLLFWKELLQIAKKDYQEERRQLGKCYQEIIEITCPLPNVLGFLEKRDVTLYFPK